MHSLVDLILILGITAQSIGGRKNITFYAICLN